MSPVPPPTAPHDTHLTSSQVLVPGSVILEGRFRVERLLGTGGMGLIYLAEQVSLGRKVAVKVLRNDVPIDAHMGERFRREALLLSSVDHPAVVRVIDFGHTTVGPCLVMELVEGETLESVLLRQGALELERAERIMTQLAQGLAAIHAKGIVHRDLKPENVVLTKSADGTDQARLLDFGIARLAEPDDNSKVTQAGFVLGTPEYLAPEQALGQPLDARSDLYALGVIAFRMLAGRHPFPGPSAREFVSQHIHQEAPKLLTVAPRLRQVPHLAEVVMSCLEKAPDKRPQTALRFLERLKQLQVPITFSGAMRIEASTQSMPVERGFFRGRLGLAVTLFVAAAVSGVLGVVWWSQPIPKARRLVEAGRGSEALQVIDDSGEAANGWQMKMLKAAALYQVGKSDDALKILETVPDTVDLEAEAVEAVADGFGRSESPRLRKLLTRLPKSKTLSPLQKLAKGDSNWAQWGALRFIDSEWAGQGLPLTRLYIAALERKDCAVRRAAAKRLAELHAVEAKDDLKKLKSLPRRRTMLADDECGQEAAAQALSKLEKE